MVNARGTSDGVTENQLPEGVESLEELNIQQQREFEAVEEHEQQPVQVKEEEQHSHGMRM